LKKLFFFLNTECSADIDIVEFMYFSFPILSIKRRVITLLRTIRIPTAMISRSYDI